MTPPTTTKFPQEKCERGHKFVENIGNSHRAICVRCGLKVKAYWGSRGEKGWQAV